MRVLLDTQILLWELGARQRLSVEVLDTPEDPLVDVLFSAASIWEIAIKTALRRADFGVRPDEIARAATVASFVQLPFRAALFLRPQGRARCGRPWQGARTRIRRLQSGG